MHTVCLSMPAPQRRAKSATPPSLRRLPSKHPHAHVRTHLSPASTTPSRCSRFKLFLLYSACRASASASCSARTAASRRSCCAGVAWVCRCSCTHRGHRQQSGSESCRAAAAWGHGPPTCSHSHRPPWQHRSSRQRRLLHALKLKLERSSDHAAAHHSSARSMKVYPVQGSRRAAGLL